MMTSSNGNIFRVTGPLCGEFTGPGEFPTQRPVRRSFDVFFDLRLNKPLSKQSWGRWFETLSRPLWRHRNAGWVMSLHPQTDTTWESQHSAIHVSTPFSWSQLLGPPGTSKNWDYEKWNVMVSCVLDQPRKSPEHHPTSLPFHPTPGPCFIVIIHLIYHFTGCDYACVTCSDEFRYKMNTS